MIKTRYMAIAGTVMVLATAFCACKGRTADNMEPLGETVEVDIPMPTETQEGRGAPRSASQLADSLTLDQQEAAVASVDSLGGDAGI